MVAKYIIIKEKKFIKSMYVSYEILLVSGENGNTF